MRRKNDWMSMVLSFVGVSLLVVQVGMADDKADKGDQTKTAVKKSVAGEKSTAKKERAKPRGRLPFYFASVVDAKQREKIYAIQAEYQEKINEILAQLKEVQEEREAEIDAVLTPEQLAKVNAKRKEAKDRRAKRIAERTKLVPKKGSDTTKE